MKHKMDMQIRFKDLDSMGHVNNANYFTYFELARVEYFKVAMGSSHIDWSEDGVIMGKAEMTYKKPILLDDKISVYTWVSRLGNKSFDMDCSIVKVVGDQEVEMAFGKAVIVCFNYRRNETIAIPPLWIEKIKAFEAQ